MPESPAVQHDAGVLLRPWQADDLPALLRHADDRQVARGLAERFPSPYTRRDGEDFLAGKVLDLSGPLRAIVIDGQACGGIGIRPMLAERSHSASLGYWLGRGYWGRGVMCAVVSAYVPWVFESTGLLRLSAEVMDFNLASMRVLLGNGFQPEGVERHAVFKNGQFHDVHRFGLTRPAASH